jgi:hypothetical protein
MTSSRFSTRLHSPVIAAILADVQGRLSRPFTGTDELFGSLGIGPVLAVAADERKLVSK